MSKEYTELTKRLSGKIDIQHSDEISFFFIVGLISSMKSQRNEKECSESFEWKLQQIQSEPHVLSYVLFVIVSTSNRKLTKSGRRFCLPHVNRTKQDSSIIIEMIELAGHTQFVCRKIAHNLGYRSTDMSFFVPLIRCRSLISSRSGT